MKGVLRVFIPEDYLVVKEIKLFQDRPENHPNALKLREKKIDSLCLLHDKK